MSLYNRLMTNSNEPEPVELTEYRNGKSSPQQPIASSIEVRSSSANASDADVKEEAIIRLRNIHKTYLLGLEGVAALRGVSVTINRGEFIVILGKSGGGKTSMLNIIGTIDKPTKGDLYIAGKRISNKTTDSEVATLRLKRIGFCFQTFNLISSMTALENVELPMILHGTLSSAQIRERAMQLLTHVGLKDRAGHLPSQLSGGEQQRVTISRAIANNPDVLLLDEPTGDLDTKNGNIIMDLLLRLNREQRITLIFVTHDVGLKQFAHRVIHMLDGKISRIECITETQRRSAEQELQQAMMHDNDPDQQRRDASSTQEVEIREPTQFYPYLAFKNSFDAKQQSLLQKKQRKAIAHNDDDDDDVDDIEEDDAKHSDMDANVDLDGDNMHVAQNESIELETAETRHTTTHNDADNENENQEEIEH